MVVIAFLFLVFSCDVIFAASDPKTNPNAPAPDALASSPALHSNTAPNLHASVHPNAPAPESDRHLWQRFHVTWGEQAPDLFSPPGHVRGRTETQDMVDKIMADNGFAVPAQIHEQPSPRVPIPHRPREIDSASALPDDSPWWKKYICCCCF